MIKTLKVDGEKDACSQSPKKTNLAITKNYRGITLTAIAAKVYNLMLRNRIRPKID